jgi:dynein heavy chain, axonemal
LRYIFGEIMYGGHVTDDWDRRLVSSYLQVSPPLLSLTMQSYMSELLFDGLELFEGFAMPSSSMAWKDMAEYLDNMPPESPVPFGLHPNAEIGFRLSQTDTIFKGIQDLQPKSASGGGGMSLQDRAKQVLDDITEKMPEMFIIKELLERIEDRTPYVNVFIQEIERMNTLLFEMRSSLQRLDLGLRGDLQISESMEQLMRALFEDKVSSSWEKLAYPSLKPLGLWFTGLLERVKQLQDWTVDLGLPKVTWLSGLFNPQSFLTAVMQTTARRNDWPLDKTVIQTEVTKKTMDDIQAPSRDGAFINGLVRPSGFRRQS